MKQKNKGFTLQKFIPGNYLNLVKDNSNFRKLWIGLTASYFGDSFYELAIVWFAYSITGSGMQVGFILVATFLPSVLVGPFLGVIVDRFDRRRLMQLAQLIQGLSVGVLALSIAMGFFHMWLLYVLTIIQSTASALFLPAQNALVPHLVKREQIIQANSFFTSSRQVATLFGAVLGGGIVAWAGASVAIAFNALTFVLALLFIQFIHDTSKIDTDNAKKSQAGILADIQEGIRWLRNQPTMMSLLVLATIGNMALGPINVLVPMLIQEVFHANATALGLFDGALGLGVLLGGLGIGILNPKRIGLVFGIALSIEAIGMFLIFIAPVLPIAYAGSFMVGIAIVSKGLPLSSAFQIMVPSDLRGRVSSINNMIAGVTIPISYGLIGLFGDMIGAAYCFLLSSILFVICMVIAFLKSRLREFKLEKHETTAEVN
ncbi:MFS transporter [Halobacillus shinanisalinarum]|uniref:MFS transporter n=1 Tax=Halobacillus shinanisalinarum TaxID=2932258 RepID=A0ABY4GVP5_9BACI|nr:MFS transporter [Halobacillus shinanisalinarum]UOQ91457.1 MFS transporter [Halobacillus shinanisalinarum]